MTFIEISPFLLEGRTVYRTSEQESMFFLFSGRIANVVLFTSDSDYLPEPGSGYCAYTQEVDGMEYKILSEWQVSAEMLTAEDWEIVPDMKLEWGDSEFDK
jgi:hypothetical protein